MKFLFKISSFTIFVATVASAFTSCGNESELFDEPVVYQTRAMTRTSMGGEPVGVPTLEKGNESISKIIIKDELSLNVELTWGPDESVASGEYIHQSSEPKYINKSYFGLIYNFVEKGIHNNKVFAKYYVEEVYKNVLPFGTVDTIKLQKYVTADADVIYHTTYYKLQSNSLNDSTFASRF